MSESRTWPLAAVSVSAVLVSLLCLPFSAQGRGFPYRLFEVETGSVEIEGGLRGFTDEILLFMVVGNATGKTILAEVEFRVPETGELLTDSKRIKHGDSETFRWPVSTVFWDTEYPFTVSVYAPSRARTGARRRKKLLGSEQSAFFFDGGDDRGAFEKARTELQPNQAASFNGFRELTHQSLGADVPGTVTDSVLQRDVIVRLFAEESKLYKECEHHVLKAELYGESDRSVIAADMGEELQELERKLRATDEMFIEKWFVQSCDAVNVYEVLLLRYGSETSISIQKLD